MYRVFYYKIKQTTVIWAANLNFYEAYYFILNLTLISKTRKIFVQKSHVQNNRIDEKTSIIYLKHIHAQMF